MLLYNILKLLKNIVPFPLSNGLLHRYELFIEKGCENSFSSIRHK